jgi:hypothetical protein
MDMPVWHFIISFFIYLAANETSEHHSVGLQEINVYLHKMTQYSKAFEILLE